MSGELELLPNMRQVRDFYCHARQSTTQRWRDHSFEAEFDHWRARNDAEVAAKAWDEGHDAGWNSRDDDAARGWVPSGIHESDAVNPYREGSET